MEERMMRLLAFVLSSALVLSAQDKYTGPIPPKADVVYLLHADNLIETEVSEAKEETRKDTQVASVPGATSPAKTPLAEPIFLVKTQKLVADRLSAYRYEVKNGNREVVVNTSRRGKNAKRIHLVVTKLASDIYKVEVDSPLENGEYCLSPDGSNQAFSFQVY
jgi:hypothetical protein